MDTARLKAFAQNARRQLMAAVTVKLDDALAARTPDYLATYAPQVAKLRMLAKDDRSGLVERAAYTWFNRLAALRFMDARGWHPFHVRVITPATGSETQPELLKLTRTGALPEELQVHTNSARLNDLLDGRIPSSDAQGDVYRHLVLATCRFYHDLLPDLFEKLDDETELLLPDDLLTEHSVIQGFRTEIADEDCGDGERANVELLGWLYQFYISERKEDVMGRKSAVPTEDIPAVTQLFTPHWIVRYLVENTLGRLWLLNRPSSNLREQMPYYIEGELETDFLKITKPEEIRVLDPAVGSGHMLTYAFDLLTLIYEEEGYAPAEIPGLILRHNLHGMDICPRAAQLAELALAFKARDRYRRFFQPEYLVHPNIIELRQVSFTGNEIPEYIHALGLGDVFTEPMLNLLLQFEDAKTVGSLIRPCIDEPTIATARRIIQAKDLDTQLLLHTTHAKVLRLLEQAEALTQRYQVVVANPPYMGSRQMNLSLKTFAKKSYSESRSDLFAMFIERGFSLAIPHGTVGIVTMVSWMFLSSYEELRARLIQGRTIITAVHMPYLGKGGTSMGISFGTAAVVFGSTASPSFEGRFSCVRYYETDDAGVPTEFPVQNERLSVCNNLEFSKLPGAPIAYWVSKAFRQAFVDGVPLHEYATPRAGMITGSNASFVRRWHEVSRDRVAFNIKSSAEARTSSRRWFPYQKGGAFRKWFGNYEFVVDWEDDGRRLKTTIDDAGKVPAHAFNEEFIFRPNVNWSAVTSSAFSTRITLNGCLFDAAGSAAFPSGDHLYFLSAFLNSRVSAELLKAINPTLNFQAWEIGGLPVLASALSKKAQIDTNTANLRESARSDWYNFETSWDFHDQPLLRPNLKDATLEMSWHNWEAQSTAAVRRMQQLET